MPAAIPIAASVAGAVASKALNGGGPSGQQTTTNKIELDPRMHEILYGTGRKLKTGVTPIYGPSTESSRQWVRDYDMDGPMAGHWVDTPGQQGQMINPESDYENDSGILGRITGLLDQPQKPGISGFGSDMDAYLGTWGRDNFYRSQQAAQRLQDSNISAPQMQAASMSSVPGMSAAQMPAAQIDAPSQNDLNLSPAYSDLIYGQPGNNPYLTGAIQKGINQSSNAFSDMLSGATRSLTQDILPSIRSGAIVNGAMGGSRQGIAEGKALQDFSTQMGQAMQRFGQGNTDAAVTAQAGQYDADRNRALSATQGLGAQQYGVATQNAGFEQQANATNAGFQQDAARTNYAGLLDTLKTNAGFKQQAAGSNQQAQLGTNQLNSNNISNGISGSSGLLGQAYGFGTNSDAYTGNKVGQVAGLLAPFTGLGATGTSVQPLYSNTGANVLGGAVLGQQLGKGFGGTGSWWNSSNPLANPNADNFNFFANNYNSENYG